MSVSNNSRVAEDVGKRDFYETLGVAKTATDAELKAAFRKSAMQCHPDRHPGDKQAETRFKELNEAYQHLSDAQKRAAYDRYGHAAFEQGGAGMGDGFGSSMSDIFDDLFGDIMGRRGQRNPSVLGQQHRRVFRVISRVIRQDLRYQLVRRDAAAGPAADEHAASTRDVPRPAAASVVIIPPGGAAGPGQVQRDGQVPSDMPPASGGAGRPRLVQDRGMLAGPDEGQLEVLNAWGLAAALTTPDGDSLTQALHRTATAAGVVLPGPGQMRADIAEALDAEARARVAARVYQLNLTVVLPGGATLVLGEADPGQPELVLVFRPVHWLGTMPAAAGGGWGWERTAPVEAVPEGTADLPLTQDQLTNLVEQLAHPPEGSGRFADARAAGDFARDQSGVDLDSGQLVLLEHAVLARQLTSPPPGEPAEHQRQLRWLADHYLRGGDLGEGLPDQWVTGAPGDPWHPRSWLEEIRAGESRAPAWVMWSLARMGAVDAPPALTWEWGLPAVRGGRLPPGTRLPLTDDQTSQVIGHLSAPPPGDPALTRQAVTSYLADQGLTLSHDQLRLLNDQVLTRRYLADVPAGYQGLDRLERAVAYYLSHGTPFAPGLESWHEDIRRSPAHEPARQVLDDIAGQAASLEGEVLASVWLRGIPADTEARWEQRRHLHAVAVHYTGTGHLDNLPALTWLPGDPQPVYPRQWLAALSMDPPDPPVAAALARMGLSLPSQPPAAPLRARLDPAQQAVLNQLHLTAVTSDPSDDEVAALHQTAEDAGITLPPVGQLRQDLTSDLERELTLPPGQRPTWNALDDILRDHAAARRLQEIFPHGVPSELDLAETTDQAARAPWTPEDRQQAIAALHRPVPGDDDPAARAVAAIQDLHLDIIRPGGQLITRHQASTPQRPRLTLAYQPGHWRGSRRVGASNEVTSRTRGALSTEGTGLAGWPSGGDAVGVLPAWSGDWRCQGA